MRSGAREWRLTGKDMVAGPISWQIGTIQLAAAMEKMHCVSCPVPLGTFDWQQVSVEWTAPTGRKYLSSQAGQNGCTGTLWFDDIKLKRIDQP